MIKLLPIFVSLALCLCHTSTYANVEAQLVASDSDSDRIWIVWSVTRDSDRPIFVRGALAVSGRDLKGLFSEPIAYVRLDTMEGSVDCVPDGTEKVPGIPFHSIPLHDPESLHELQKAMHHGAVPLRVGIGLPRQPVIDWFKAHRAVMRVHAEFRSPTFEFEVRAEETSQPLILSADLHVSADRSLLIVDIPKIEINFPSVDFGQDKKPNQSLEPMARSVTPRAAHVSRPLPPWLTI